MLNEFDIVNWYIEVLEGGFNSKTILKDFIVAQAELKKLKEDSIITKNRFEKELEKKGQQYIDTKNSLIKL